MERLREGKIYSGTVEGYTSEGQGVVRLEIQYNRGSIPTAAP